MIFCGVPPELHTEIAAKAAAEDKSLHKCVTDLSGEAIQLQSLTFNLPFYWIAGVQPL